MPDNTVFHVVHMILLRTCGKIGRLNEKNIVVIWASSWILKIIFAPSKMDDLSLSASLSSRINSVTRWPISISYGTIRTAKEGPPPVFHQGISRAIKAARVFPSSRESGRTLIFKLFRAKDPGKSRDCISTRNTSLTVPELHLSQDLKPSTMHSWRREKTFGKFPS